MSSSFSNSQPVQSLGQSSPPLASHNPFRVRQGQTQALNSGQQPYQKKHTQNGSITSNPSQPVQSSQYLEGDSGYFFTDQHFDFSVTGSPGTIGQSTNLYNFEEDSSHHESSLDDFLTTETSSENPLSEHTTPQELIWEQQFVTQDTSQPYIVDPYGVHQYSAQQGIAGADNQAVFNTAGGTFSKFGPNEHLLEPDFIDPAGTQQLADAPTEQSSSMASSLISPLAHRKGSSQTLKVNTQGDPFPTFPQTTGSWPPPISNNPVPSPSVVVSSYEREAHSGIQQAPGKRSRASDSSEDEDDEENLENSDSGSGVANTYSSHLMPPDANDVGTIRSAPSPRVGQEPSRRNEDTVPSLKDIEHNQDRHERDANVETWLATSDAGSEPDDQALPRPTRQRSTSARRRTQTVGAQTDVLGRVYSDKGIPGPGALIDVETDDEYFEDVASVASSIRQNITEEAVVAYHRMSPKLSPHTLAPVQSPEQSSFPPLDSEVPLESEEPHPRQFFRRAAPGSGTNESREQADSSNAAAYKYNQEAAKWETASRAATWGTRRRLSESEVNSIVDGSQVRHLSLSKRGRERGSSILNKARGLLPRRSSSNIKVEQIDMVKAPAEPGHAHRSSVGTLKTSQRKSSFTKARSPPLDTGSALMAMTGQLTAIGRSSTKPQEPDPPKTSRGLGSLRKQRTKSDVTKKSAKPGLAELMTRHGGPPIPTLASPMHERETILAAQVIDNEDVVGDDDEDDEVGIHMELEIRADEITPNLEGFKDHSRKLNPRLEPYLIERIGQEQVRRYKRLVEQKIKHMHSVQKDQKCGSGTFCFDLGGEAKLLAPRVSSRDPEATLTQFQVTNTGENEIDESGFTEGVVTPALFPPGIPLPPAKRLPAEFECQLCFKVKKFSKPSDWTKHVHEDIQPFSCTFPNCTESKSFKRKADWVRHENERHRHLEWWKCSHQECSHICYRKDNFVQHLVREHKMTEPKVKGRGSGSSKNKPINGASWPAGQEDSELWQMVDDCHFETTNKARDEHCRFCGNVCSSYKKLSVHMGKHMEQIAMPVLELVRMRIVGPDTIISPIEQAQPISSFVSIPGNMNGVDSNNLSPYPTSAVSAYQTSSAGQSPASMQGRIQHGNFTFDQGYYSPHSMGPGVQAQMVTDPYSSSPSYPNHNRMYMDGSEFLPTQNTVRKSHSHSPQNQLVTPRSQHMGPGFTNTYFDPTGAAYSQTPLQPVYTDSSSSGGYISQYAPSGLPNHPVHSPLGMNGHSGLGLQTMNQQQQQQYMYGGQGNGNGPPMQYS
ncbi:hypothetical protein LTR84_004548 [Exophiala bonariae]|uniref:C2H2-type domain-containing protein n=1 Tax=Exophiala bonariae TaxID=1690606 RepID=A0AAV9NNU4_9EURO|nr:hypothetical protein LTR84_004548 [Exophiala bonariae]